jgi:hypothetical protein
VEYDGGGGGSGLGGAGGGTAPGGVAASGPPDGGVDCGVDTWASYGSGFFATWCTGCHPQYGDQATVRAALGRMYSALSSGVMPQVGFLSPDELSRILNYLECRAP